MEHNTSQNPFDDPEFGASAKPDVSKAKSSHSANPFDDPDFGKPAESRGVLGTVKDIGVWTAKGLAAVPEAAIGLADIPTGGRVGKVLDESLGIRPKQWKGSLNELHTDATKAAQQKFEEADGVWEKTKAAVQNPSNIAGAVIESLPSMFAGGYAGRAALAGARGAGLVADPTKIAQGASAAAKSAAGAQGLRQATVAGAAGEGLVMAGAQAEAIRQETEDGLLTPAQAGAALGTGVLGGAFGYAGGKLANKLGIGDAETMLVQGQEGLRKQIADNAATAAVNPLVQQTALKSIPRKVIEGAIVEGFLEELPQSVSEQIIQNLALGKEWYEEVDAAIVLGTLSGGAMGAGAAGYRGVITPRPKAGGEAAPGGPGDGGPAEPGTEAAPRNIGLERVSNEFAARLQALQEQEQGEQDVPQSIPPNGAAVLARQQAVAQEARDSQLAASRAVENPDDEILQSIGATAMQRPSVAMGLRSGPEAGAMERAAAMAVDTGAAAQLQQAAEASQANPEPTESEAMQTAAQDAVDMKSARQKVEKAKTTVDPETGEVLGVQLAAEFADWSDEQLRNAFKSAQGKSVRQELAVELQSRRARREQEALQDELDEDLAAGEMPDVADGAFASVQEDAGPVPTRIEVQGGGESSPPAPGSKAKGANLATLAQLNRKKLAEMTTDELHQLASLLPGEHGRQEKIQKAIQARATAAQPATTEGATANGATATQNNVSQDGTTPTTQAQPQAVDPKQRITDAGAQWARMPAAERSALAARLDGVAPVIAKNLPKSQWEKLNSKLQGKIADAIKAQAAPVVGDEKAFAPETGTLGIPRADMPQVPTANHGGLVKHLNAQGIGHETKTVDAAELKPTQAEYSPSKVAATKAAEGDRSVIVSSDGHIIDGHHQAIAAAEDGKQVKAIVLDAPVEQALAAVKASPSANQVPKSAVKKVAKSLAVPRAMNDEGRAVDGGPIMPGDTFTTSSGRTTSLYPKQKGERYASQWLIDNAVAEAESRGDTFNAPTFKATTLLKSGVLTDSDRESMLMYLFGEQPAKVPGILKPIAPFANSASNLTGNSADAAPEATGKESNAGASAANDRDHFTLMRANDGGDVAPVTFARGETVKIAGTQKPYGTGVITGISHAERKFRVDGQQHGVDFGYAYPADYDEFAKPRAEVDKGLDRLAQRLAEENAIEAQKFIEAAKSVIKLHNLGDYAKARMAELTARAAEISQSVVDKMRAARERKAAEDAAARETEKAKAKPEEPVRMTMEEWKAASKDFKSIVDGQRMVMREGGMRKVVIEKPNSVSAKKLRGVVAKAAEAKIAEISADYLNGAVQGDTITASKDFDYVRGGVPLLVESISPRGDVHVFDPVDGGRTSFKADMAAGRRVTFTVEKAIAAPEPIAFLARHNAIEAGISAGTLNLDEYKSAFADLETNRDAVVAELEKLTKDELLRAGGTVFAYRNKGEKKADIVAAAYAEMMKTYALGRSYGPSSHVLSASGMSAHRAKQAEALRELVANTTAEDLSKRSAEIKSIRDEFNAEREAKAAALASPKTLQDFRGFLKHWIDQGDSGTAAFLRLTPEQRQQFDALEAAQTKEAREAAKRKALTSVQSAGNTTAGEIVATKHTQKGHDLFVVALADRVERDAYDTLNSSAKQLGGSYSSYRGNGAIPGFQFRTREAAEAFQKLVAGDTTQAQELASQRRDAFADDKSQSAAERLRTMAEELDERAADALSADRKVNTERRARFAASAEAAARMQQALAGTMRNIAKAIDDGKAQFLDGVRQRVQVEYLMGQLRNAKSNQLQAKYPEYGERMKRSGEPIDGETVDFAEFPRFEMFRSDLASLARQLQEVDGGKKMGALLAKAADDVTDAYTSWAKENLLHVSHFGNKADGGFAEFANKETAERAIKRSGLVGKAIVLPIKRGQNRVILSPGEAMQQGLWQGDGDKRMRLGLEFVEGLVKLGKRKGSKELTIPWQLESAYDNRKRLERMGIQTSAEFRSALRELASLQQEMGSPDRIKELERSMVGRANDGLDFFPTSPAVVQSMLGAAEITEGMAVLEPSAGMGHIADAIVADSGVWPDVVELSGKRRELLEAKGYHLAEANDFTQMEPRSFFTYGDTFRSKDGVEGIMRGSGGMGSQRVRLVDSEGNSLGIYDRSELTGIAQNGTDSGYDRIVMNPPFSDGRDIQHVMHAYSLLRPGGRIVAIMGEGAFFQSNKRAEAFRSWLDERGATNEKLPDGSFMDPSLPVNTGVAARMVVIDKPVAAVGVPDGDIDAFGALPRKLTQKGTPFDRAIMAMVQEGKPASDVLGMIANGSRDPFYRQLAKLMGKAKANPVLVFENEVKGGLAYYSAKRDALVMGPEAQSRAEQIFMHEFVHAVTIRALHQNSLPSLQMSKLYQHVKKRHGSAGYYGMKNVREFAAEAFTNPDFQRLLKSIDAPAGNIAKSAWDAFLRVLKNILGLPNNATDALSRALEIGVNVMREDMRVRAALAQRNTRVEPDKPSSDDAKARILQGAPVAMLDTAIAPMGAPAIRNWAAGLFSEQGGKAHNPVIGDVVLDERAVRSSIAHGRPNAYKVAAFAAVKDVLEKGAMVLSARHSRDGESFYVSAPVEIDGVANIVTVLVKRDPNDQRMYLHSVATKEYLLSRRVSRTDTGEGVERSGSNDSGDSQTVANPDNVGKASPTAVAQELGRLLSLDTNGDAGKRDARTAQQKGRSPNAVGVASGISAGPVHPGSVGTSGGSLVDTVRATQEDVDFFSAEAIDGVKKRALDQLSQTFTHPGKVSLWDKTVGTMRNLALRAPEFKPVFESAQRFIDDVSMLANDAADAAPRLMPRVESLADLKKKPITAADNKAVAKPLFEGTLMWARDMDGKPMLADELAKKYSDTPTAEKAAMLMRSGKVSDQVLKMWSGMPVGQFDAVVNGKFERDILKPGVVWTDSELKSMFGMSDNQVSLYREARAGIDRSIDMTARTDMLRMLGEEFADLREVVLEQPTLKDAFDLVVETLQTEAKDRPDMADRLLAINNSVVNRYDTAKGLMDYGYAPLSRFGQYTVDVVDQAGERQYFGMFESKREANLMRIKMATVFPGATVTPGTMSQQAFKLFQGITPESLEQFGSMLGLKSDGNEAKDKAFQAYLQLAKNNHSALKRLIHRKGIDGYSEDVGRVLASFVYSNARLGSGGLNAGTMETAVEAIPKEKGELRDAAMSLRSYIQDPQEEGQAIRGFLFAQYLGGSVASAAVNMMQPFQITMPWLSQYGGMANAAKQMTRALKDIRTKDFKNEPDLTKALQEAVDDGTVSPQEIHQLMAQARGTGSLRTGDGTKSGDARAAVANNWERVKVAWGQPFALAEQFNRHSTFIAAYRIAKEQGMANPGQFARAAVLETQFLYSKANKPRWARGAIGGTLFCVDDATEALTSQGWKTVDDLRKGDMVASFDMTTESLVWKPVKRVYQKHTSGEMVHVKDRNLDMFMTPDHRVVTYREERVPGHRNKYHRRLQIQEAQDLNSKDCIPVAAPFLHEPVGAPLSDAQVRMIGWIVTEGYFVKRNRGRTEWGGHLRIGQNEGRKADLIRRDLAAAGLPWVEHKWKYNGGNAVHVYFNVKKSACADFRNMLLKKVLTPDLLMRMTTDQIRQLVDVMVLADGSISKTGKRCFIQNPGQTLDAFQMALTMIGVAFSVHKHGPGARKVVLKDAKWYTLSRTKGARVQFEGRVWCPLVQDTHTWVARRGGRVFITHNTFKTYSVSYLELMNRMWNPPRQAGEGDDAYAPRRAAARRAVGWSIAMLMLTAGAGGLPFVEDAEDLIDGAGQMMGYNISAKQWRKEFLQSVIGAELGEFLESGMSGLPGAPIDVSGRLGLGNLIPGTGLFLSKQSRERDLLEVVGPAGDLVARGFTGARKLLTGDVAGAALEVSPTAVRNAAKGVDMAVSGMYKDTKGYKVLDTTLTEALSKAVGFQPKSVSEAQEGTGFILRTKSFYTQTSSEIRAQWADALFRKDDAALQRVRDRLAAWNRKNPDQRITIKIPDVMKRVHKMNQDRADRIADSAPRALRQQIREMSQEANR